MKSEKGMMTLLFLVPLILLVPVGLGRLNRDRQTRALEAVMSAPRLDVTRAKNLLEAGADPAGKTARGQSFIEVAANRDQMGLFQRFQSAGAPIDGRALRALEAAKKRGRNASLAWSIGGNHAGKAQKYLREGADPNARTKDGYRPLELAVRGGRVNQQSPAMIQLLLQHGAIANIKAKPSPKSAGQLLDLVPFALLHGGDTKIISALLRAGAPLPRDSRLTVAVVQRDVAQVRALLKAGVHPDTRASKLEWTPLQWAAFDGLDEICQLLLEHGANARAMPTLSGDGSAALTNQSALQVLGDFEPPKAEAARYERTRQLLKNAERKQLAASKRR